VGIVSKPVADEDDYAQAEAALEHARDFMLETWGRAADLGSTMSDLARILQRSPLAPSRMSLVQLPVYVAIDGWQWVWSAASPELVTKESKPHGFLESSEHRQSVLHEVFTTDQPKRVRLDAGPVPYPFLESLRARGATDYLAMPLSRRHAGPTVLTLATHRRGGWSDDPVRVLHRVRSVLSLLVEVSETQRLLDLAATDPLTGVANRRSFERSLRQSLAMCRRTQEQLSLLYFDVDHFKAFNDCYGHGSGDECLVKVAQAAASGLREMDSLARVGGEEFAVILPGCSALGAMRVGERIRANVEALAIPHTRSQTRSFVTVSVGAISAPPNAPIGMSELVGLADNALYEAKKLGRDCVVAREWREP
jgi:diguanylate cyclase (GGDEF)-like protein